jgi:hypothetical protein
MQLEQIAVSCRKREKMLICSPCPRPLEKTLSLHQREKEETAPFCPL